MVHGVVFSWVEVVVFWLVVLELWFPVSWLDVVCGIMVRQVSRVGGFNTANHETTQPTKFTTRYMEPSDNLVNSGIIILL